MSSVYERTVSSFPISIGTAIALESIFSPRIDPYDPERKIPNNIDINNYTTMYFNMLTLFRNLQGSLDKEVFLMAKDNELTEALIQEMDVIKSLFSVEGNGVCTPIFFIPTYDYYYKNSKFKMVYFRKDKTEFQKLYTGKQGKVLHNLLQKKEIEKIDYQLPVFSTKKALLLSHIPLDLLNYKYLNTLDLVESHTGKLKSRNTWNSKYYPIPDTDMNIFPFNRKLLMVFGDKTIIHPADIRLRKQIADIAKARHWTTMTTLDKINLDISLTIREPLVLDFLKSIE